MATEDDRASTKATLSHTEVTAKDEAATSPCVALRCFGSLTVLRDGAPVTSWERPDERQILAVLAAHAPAGVCRDRIIDAVWPDKDGEAGRTFLKSRVYSLRKDLVLSP